MIKINLFPQRARKRLAAFSLPSLSLPSLAGLGLGLLFGVLYAATIVLVGGYWFWLIQEGRSLRAQMTRMDAEIAQYKEAIAEGNRYKKEKEELERRKALVDLITRNQNRPVHLWDVLADMVPPDLWLTAMEEKERTLRISGTAFSTTAVADFMANLKQSGKFREIDLIVSRQELAKTPRLVTFDVTCRFEI